MAAVLDVSALRRCVVGDDGASIRAAAPASFERDPALLAGLASMAVQRGAHRALEALCERVPGIAVLETGGPPPIWVAASTGAADSLELLLRAGASTALQSGGLTLAAAAALTGQRPSLEVLARLAPDCLGEVGANGQPAVCLAARTGRPDLLGAIAAVRPELLAQLDPSGQTPALIAASLGHAELLAAIGQWARASVEIATPEGMAPMDVAWNRAHVACVEALRELGIEDPAQRWACDCDPGEDCGPPP